MRARPVRGRGAGYRTALTDRLFVALVVLATAYATVYAQATVGVPLAMRDAGLAPSAYSVIPVVNGLLIVAVQPVAARWLARVAPLRVLAVSWGTVGVGMALTGLAATPAQYAATAVVWTLGEIGVGGFTASLVSDLAPASAQARYQAVFGFGWGLSKLAAAAVCGGVSATLGWGALWWGCAGLGAVCGGTAWLLVPASERRRAADPHAAVADAVPSGA
ncbi:MFS transporter [Actinomadura rupiterrae]|uniref:MFS transporter n=1 Tax=Actinomadura rupiterrae TaxID=559627 RepID=UPI0020A2408B|nr:MFS transporter [Actinomadura rupiterrae]MCP2342284.1 MFS family permease [Actinomadura rupiterrae]